MKKKHIALKNFAIIIILISLFAACDKDFASIDSDIINNDNAAHFDTNSMRFNVVTYNKKLDPVQTNNLPINLLGIYNDPVYGTTNWGVVTQIIPNRYDPTFGENVVMDSVVLTIPYFNKSVEIKDSGETIYELDSIYGTAPMKLSIYENNYFLREFDPNANIDNPQTYYSDGSTGSDQISTAQLEGRLVYDTIGFVPSEKEIQLIDSIGGEISTRSVPSIRFKLDTNYWKEKIIDKQGGTELFNANNFKNYLRGLYFKAEAIGFEGHAMLLNFTNSNASIVMYYTIDSPTEEGKRDKRTFDFTFGGQRINLITGLHLPIPPGNKTDGDEKLYLKGGQGSLAVVDLFNGFIQDPMTGFNVPQLDYFKSKKDKWLINEANLVFYVDQAAVADLNEPERIYLYDIENGIPLIDYYADLDNTVVPVNSKINHLGRLKRVDDDPEGQGIKYRIKITEHINNILLKDSTNVKLGLAVSSNVNLEGTSSQPNILTSDGLVNKVPISSVLTPLGTVLYGNNTSNQEKKVSLEIFYTDIAPNNN